MKQSPFPHCHKAVALPQRASLRAYTVALATIGNSLSQASTWQLNDDWMLTSITSLILGDSLALRNTSPIRLAIADARSIGKRSSGINYNADDGKFNFDKGDTISQIFRGSTDFDLNDGDQGAFVSFQYTYDHAYDHRSPSIPASPSVRTNSPPRTAQAFG